jgi:hypothetical protein
MIRHARGLEWLSPRWAGWARRLSLFFRVVERRRDIQMGCWRILPVDGLRTPCSKDWSQVHAIHLPSPSYSYRTLQPPDEPIPTSHFSLSILPRTRDHINDLSSKLSSLRAIGTGTRTGVVCTPNPTAFPALEWGQGTIPLFSLLPNPLPPNLSTLFGVDRDFRFDPRCSVLARFTNLLRDD